MTENDAKSTERERARPQTSGSADRPWHARAWSGINSSGWLRALSRHRFAVSPLRWPLAGILTGLSGFHSCFGGIQRLFYGNKIARTKLAEDPIFVLGHWRSGTTLLHELLVCDSRHTYPNTFCCFCPNDFLVTEAWLRPIASAFLPRKRPMDNMAIGWDLPQEDEWALCNMGLPSPYLKIMFPNQPMRDRDYLDLRNISDEERRVWQQKLLWFLKCLTVRDPKRIVLKTPAHTARVRALLEIFPRARFVHISRNPYIIFPSTVHTWARMHRYQGLQVPKNVHLEEEVLETFEQVYAAFDDDVSLIPSDRFCDVRYEDLASDPIGQMSRIYRHLDLELTEQVERGWAAYAESKSDYSKNRYVLSEEQRRQVTERWSAYIKKYGYDEE